MAFNKNPWLVESIEAFSYYCCPECVFRTKEESFFQTHALQNHSQSTSLFHHYDTKSEEPSETGKGLILVLYEIQASQNRYIVLILHFYLTSSDRF